MNNSSNILLVLIIYILFSASAKSQELYLEIYGKDSLETAVIDSLERTFPEFETLEKFKNFKSLSRETDSVFHKIQQIGYLDATISEIEKVNDSLFTVEFSLGKIYRKIRIHYDSLPFDKRTLKQLGFDPEKNHIEIPLPETESFLGFLNQEIANQGRPFSFLQLENIRKDETGIVSADLKISSSQKRQIDNIIIKGYEKFPRGFVKHFLGIKIGQGFNKKLLDEKVGRLENIRFASSIKPPEIQFTKDSTAIYLYLEKRKSNSFDGFLGFSNDSEDSKLRVTGNIDVVLLNNMNFGESLHLNYKSDGNEQIRFQATADLPYLFQSPFGLNLGLDIFKKDSTFTTVGQHAKLKYQFNEKINAFVGYRHSESNNLLDENEQIVGSVVEDFSSAFVSIGGEYVDYNTYNDLFPIKTSITLELGHGNRERFQGKTEQWLVAADASHIFELDRRNSIYVRNLSSLLASGNYLTNELFRFGGINSLRGFEENSIAASLFSSTQTEYRFLLDSNLYVHSIIDYAYFENEVFGLRENLYGIGFGIGLQTGAGLLRVNFANGKSDGQNFEFSNTKVHLSLRTVF